MRGAGAERGSDARGDGRSERGTRSAPEFEREPPDRELFSIADPEEERGAGGGV